MISPARRRQALHALERAANIGFSFRVMMQTESFTVSYFTTEARSHGKKLGI